MYAETNVKYFKHMMDAKYLSTLKHSVTEYALITILNHTKFEMISSMFAYLPDFVWEYTVNVKLK